MPIKIEEMTAARPESKIWHQGKQVLKSTIKKSPAAKSIDGLSLHDKAAALSLARKSKMDYEPEELQAQPIGELVYDSEGAILGFNIY